jgi:hypothetical protein
MTTVDFTEAARRALLPTMPDALAAAVETGEEVWDSDGLR